MADGNPTRKDNAQPATSAARIVLTFTASPWHLDIKGEVENYDVALAMLEQAKRHFEQQLRLQAAMQMQEQIIVAAENARIAAAVRTGVPHS
jgi:16S rRNA G1207 methylase RsmC